MSFSYSVIVLFVLLGACVAVAMAYAMARFCISQDTNPADAFHRPPEFQEQYMREVRARNQDSLCKYIMVGRRSERTERSGGPKVQA